MLDNWRLVERFHSSTPSGILESLTMEQNQLSHNLWLGEWVLYYADVASRNYSVTCVFGGCGGRSH